MADRNEQDEYQRLIDEQREGEATTKPAKPFVHREPPPSKCGSCQLSVTRQQRRVCAASAMPIGPDSGVGRCAWLPIRKVSDD